MVSCIASNQGCLCPAAAVFEGFLVGDLRDAVRELREAGAVARLNSVQVRRCCSGLHLSQD